jgi:putative SOS response-associated peptidase YedK
MSSPGEVVAEAFALAAAPDLAPRYNIAPTQEAAVVRGGEAKTRELAMLRWGLIPAWSKDPGIGNRLINARAESAADKPAFRAALRHRRCLVVADGFYEWRRLAGRKQPYLVRFRDRRPFGFAGLWERWRAPEGGTIESFASLTADVVPVSLRVNSPANDDPGLLEPAG